MHQRRDIIILLALFTLLAVFTVLGPGSNRDDNVSAAPTTHSSSPQGALGLLRWFGELGYKALRLEYTAFAVNDQTDALFVLGPSQPFNQTQTEQVLDWVEQGGVLVVADDQGGLFAGPGSSELLTKLEIELDFYDPADENAPRLIETAPVVQPLPNAPPVQQIDARTSRVLKTEREDIVPIVAVPEGIVVAGLKYGEGYVYVSSATYPFTNAGLRDAQNAALVLNILRGVPAGGTVLFDEYHHGFFVPPSLRTLVLSSPWGWAALYTLAMVTGYFVITGWRFGRPIPLAEEVARRSSAEYVESMADMLQRGDKREFVQQHYATAFKRRLARPYGINPQLDDEGFVTELARHRDIDTAALRQLFVRLRRRNNSPDDLLRLIAETDAVALR